MVEKDAEISMARQASLLGVNRSMLYYRPAPVSEVDDGLMKMIDRQYLATPFYGSRRMAEFLRRNDRLTNRKHVQRLMRLMGLQAIYPKPKTSLRDKQHEVYPYLLRDLPILRPDHVWATDLTYIPMRRGFMYLMAIIDWFSRYVVAWGLSNTMDVGFCISVLNEALCRGRPDIFNSDQGSQFTSKAFTQRLKQAGILISMDGVGRCLDNVFVERLWWSVKHEEVYLKDYVDGHEAHANLEKYFDFFNTQRPHQGLGYRTPNEVYNKRQHGFSIS